MIPSFARPPVAEVAFSVQFREPVPITVLHLGALRDAFPDRYPSVQERPPMPPIALGFRPGPVGIMSGRQRDAPRPVRVVTGTVAIPAPAIAPPSRRVHHRRPSGSPKGPSERGVKPLANYPGSSTGLHRAEPLTASGQIPLAIGSRPTQSSHGERHGGGLGPKTPNAICSTNRGPLWTVRRCLLSRERSLRARPAAGHAS